MTERLPAAKLVLLQPPGDLPRAQALVPQCLDGSDQPDLRRQPDGDEEGLDALFELRLAGGENPADVPGPPRVL